MRKRVSSITIVLVLLVLLCSIIPFYPILHKIQATQADVEFAAYTTASDESTGVNLTWTSLTQQIPQVLENSTKAVGDHVVLNATFPDNENITRCKLHIWDRFLFATNRSIAPTSTLGGFEMFIYQIVIGL